MIAPNYDWAVEHCACTVVNYHLTTLTKPKTNEFHKSKGQRVIYTYKRLLIIGEGNKRKLVVAIIFI